MVLQKACDKEGNPEASSPASWRTLHLFGPALVYCEEHASYSAHIAPMYPSLLHLMAQELSETRTAIENPRKTAGGFSSPAPIHGAELMLVLTVKRILTYFTVSLAIPLKG